MNKAKEKKLNTIKSEILEIKEFIISNKKDENVNVIKDNQIKTDFDDTLTLTNIVDSKEKVQTKDDFAKIKNELYILRSMLNEQKIVLKEILLKIK